MAWIAAAGELVGLAAELLDRSVEHAQTRVQFSRPIGSFQAVKHRLVDALLMIERARSLTRYAALAVAEGREDVILAGHRAKAAASEAASATARTAVQVHGGVGITAEHDISLLYLRARQLSMLLGGPETLRLRVPRVSGSPASAGEIRHRLSKFHLAVSFGEQPEDAVRHGRPCDDRL